MPLDASPLFQPVELPCGVVLRNRIIKSAMSDSLGDGCGNPTAAQTRLYERWAEGGPAATIIGEVQGSGRYAEKPGNLVLEPGSDMERFRELARRGSAGGTLVWLQLGHAGAMAHPPTSRPMGPSALDLPGLRCGEMTAQEITALPQEFARTARLARDLGFGGVQVHAAHGFLLSQFLSPLFNQRSDAYGGSLHGRTRFLMEVVEAVREAVGPGFPVAVKLNATDQLEGGLTEEDALEVVGTLNGSGIDLIDISGGTYFPGAKSASDSGGSGPYFVGFAERARTRTDIPLMATGGFKSRGQAEDAVLRGVVDVVGLARAFVLDPDVPKHWREGHDRPDFPRFSRPPEGGITAWYTMRLTEIGEERAPSGPERMAEAIQAYESRDQERVALWNGRFGGQDA